MPLEYLPGQNRESLALTGEELFSITGITDQLVPGKKLTVTASSHSVIASPQGEAISEIASSLKIAPRNDGKSTVQFEAVCRIDTPVELSYYQHGGILHYVLRQLMK